MQIACSHCGSSNPASHRFCVVCGARLGVVAGAPAAVRAQPPPPPPPSVQTAVAPVPQLAGRYIVDRTLGRGGMSTVYRAYDTHFSNRVVAVKEMVDSFASVEERAEAERDFLREADLLAALRHPAIPAVFDRFSANSRHYLVMEYIEGENLEAMLNKRAEPYPEDQVRTWALDLCALLRYLHGQQPPVIFRDLKPGNILVEPSGRLRLIDFGIARFFKHSQSTDTTALGTSGYASPEHYTGQTDARSDIYSLGATLHHLLTLRDPSRHPPFQFPAVRSLNAAVSPELEALIARAISVDRGGRFANVGEVEAALQGRVRAPRARPQPSQSPLPGLVAPRSSPSTTPGALVLVITRLSRNANFSGLSHEVAPLIGQTIPETANRLRRLPLVEPIVAVSALGQRLKRLRDLGCDARHVLPATDSVRLDPALQQELLAHHQIVIWDVKVGVGKACRCWHCGHRWLTSKAVGDPVPQVCNRCGQKDWSRRRLCKCAWCGHEFEVKYEARSPDHLRPECECCGQRNWLVGRRGGWQGLVQTFREMLGLSG